MARLLLYPRGAALLLAALLVPMSGCIIPVAPDFQDPVGSPNLSPYLYGATPAFGTVVTVPSPKDTVPIGCFAADPNSGDTLYVMWVLDYPPATESTRAPQPIALPPPVSGPQVQLLSYGANCAPGPAANATGLHQLQLLVADRPFIYDGPNLPLDHVESGGFVAYGNWTVYLPCATSGSAGTSP
jgi:hypothetical protein